PPAPPAAPATPPPPPPATPPTSPPPPPFGDAEAPTTYLPAVSDLPPVPPPPMGGPSPVPTTPPAGAPIGWATGADERYDLGRHGRTPPPGPEPVTAPSPVVARLVVSDGTVVDVDRPVLIGRAPEARRVAGGEDARLVTVPSPHQEISATHLEVSPGAGADMGSAVVTDLGSTNGSVLARPGLPPEALQPGISARLVPGSLIDLGDGVTIQVTTP
ncbi:FHA domain-containing protein, partial [Nocardioides sp. zg-DK7169]|uniref:FHA domain-containing protein n=1 Tax=Nocardioides sp. zg-DK7169 TaxID=2736600 RepID=UPI001555D652